MEAATGVSPTNLLRLPSPHTPVSSSSALLQRRFAALLSFAAASSPPQPRLQQQKWLLLRFEVYCDVNNLIVSASYEQALMDARKKIEREMERFKDPREKAKAETRDWLNGV
ncbi:hypothetical protein ZWY2020_009098 [Hordeum vulgare]|nr:hypothetical protein ZWY2020_009098 [Hordeum vulgare]